jgi:hypothetical protein
MGALWGIVIAGLRVHRRGARARGKRGVLQFQGGSRKGAAEVVLGIGVAAREAGTSESQDGKDLGQRRAPRKQILGDPQIGDAPIGRGVTLRNAQPVHPTGVDGRGSSG